MYMNLSLKTGHLTFDVAAFRVDICMLPISDGVTIVRKK